MLGKYLKFIRGGKSGGDKPKAVPPVSSPAVTSSSSLGESIPLLDSIPSGADEEAIDTGHIAADNVVASIPKIETHGQRTNREKLRLKIIGRQPVLDRSQQIIGYELLLRSKVLPTVKEPDAAVRRMQDEALIHCLADLDVDRLLEDKLAFVGISPVMLDSPMLQKLPCKGVVLLVCPDQDTLEDNLLRCRELRSMGYQIALDDFEAKRGLGQFLTLASFIRVDVARFNAIELGKLADRFLDKSSPQLLAKNVETDDDFDACYKMNFHCFEGNYFTRLRPSMPPRVDSDRIRVLELLNKVKSQAEISQLEEGFKHDAMLSYKLLRYINAPVNGFQQQIRSIAHALVILGYKQLYRWLTLLLFTSGKADPRSKALLQNALVRARMTELLGQSKLSPTEREGLFIVGIFSLLDVLLNVPMAQALEQLQLPDPVMAALARREGVYAPFLALAVACEEADQEGIIEHAAACGLDANEVNTAQLKALVWAEEINL
ncbi:diguanylate phosphodiesterase [Sulfuricella denitrificans skB26]|uniref:Diguanylate phosphodiesterase n=1 Tax=Sulfuricella denitrificans (strain DSM 22764 / NBRC 105220 / skB26) TaxID=1163617 RepID=S6AHN2_SULDS|nr:HDOD domain-containing protein [Sulfuricella denitrificans]BAN35661.1 diguanylate phosphodiesterase [Sulfuricella denitrificans skB26]